MNGITKEKVQKTSSVGDVIFDARSNVRYWRRLVEKILRPRRLVSIRSARKNV